MTDRDCPHGQLARSCNICDMEREIASQAQTIARLLQIEAAALNLAKVKGRHNSEIAYNAEVSRERSESA